MTRSVLMSLLVRQHLALKAGFSRRYPHAWLVWEAGAWNVTDTGEQNLARTRLPTAELRDCLPQGDVLCFELAMPATNRPLSVGRASGNDVVLNDATVSREHVALREVNGRWEVEVLSENQAVLNSRSNLAQGRATVLSTGDQITLGDVTLTYYDPAGFLERIQSEQRKLLQAAAVAGRREVTVG